MSDTADQTTSVPEPGTEATDTIVLEGVEKIYPGSTQPAVSQLDMRHPQGRDRHAHRPLGLRQDDDAQDDQPAHRADRGPHPAQRQGRHPRQRRPPAPRDRLRHPAGRSLPALLHRRQHRRGPEDARLGQAADPGAGRRAAPPRRARALDVPRPLPAPALRRPAAACRRRPGPRRRPARHAHGRAVRRHRPDHPRPPPGRVPGDPAHRRQDDRLRHPRPRRRP